MLATGMPMAAAAAETAAVPVSQSVKVFLGGMLTCRARDGW